MSTPAFRSLSQRAGGGLVRARNPPCPPTFSYGRTAAYRRIGARLHDYTTSSLHRTPEASSILSPALVLRSRFLPPSISATTISVRHVSFKELREERARQRRGESEPAKPQPKAEPEPEKVKAEQQSAADAAEEAYAKAQAESDAQEKASGARQEGEQKSEEGAEGEGEAKGEKKPPPPPPPHGDKTPWQVFTETLRTEFKASKEWNESTKQLSGTMHDFTQNPNVQKAKTAFTTAETITGNVVKGTASAVGKGAAWTWDTPVVKGVRIGVGAVGSGVEKVTRPVRQTEAYKNVKEVIDDGSSSRYGGWTEKEERRRRREEQLAKKGNLFTSNPNANPAENFEEDPNAGTNVTLHKDAAWKESWRTFRDSSPVMQRLFSLKSSYAESENPLISTARSVSDRIAGFFAENETAQVIKKFREMDPSFQLEPFLNEMRNYILPEVLEAYVKGDVEVLKLWLSAAQFQVYSALMSQYTTAGLKSDGKILDIRNVDILSARMLEPGDIPVFVIMCRTQEVHVYRNAKSNELAAGMEDKVQQVTYAIGVTRIPEEVANPETRGWRLIELQKSGRDYI